MIPASSNILTCCCCLVAWRLGTTWFPLSIISAPERVSLAPAAAGEAAPPHPNLAPEVALFLLLVRLLPEPEHQLSVLDAVRELLRVQLLAYDHLQLFSLCCIREILREDDEKLQALKEEAGQEAHDVVVKALLEMNEYNLSCRYAIPVSWSFKDHRRAPLDEAVDYMLKKWKVSKKKTYQ